MFPSLELDIFQLFPVLFIFMYCESEATGTLDIAFALGIPFVNVVTNIIVSVPSWKNSVLM